MAPQMRYARAFAEVVRASSVLEPNGYCWDDDDGAVIVAYGVPGFHELVRLGRRCCHRTIRAVPTRADSAGPAIAIG